MRKVLIELLKVSIVCLICCLITTMIIDKRVDSIDKRVDSIEKYEVDSNEKVDSNENYEKLVIEEIVEIYGSDVYGYIIEELECKSLNEGVKYSFFVRFYDGDIYVERLMYVTESGNVYTEKVIERIEG